MNDEAKTEKTDEQTALYNRTILELQEKARFEDSILRVAQQTRIDRIGLENRLRQLSYEMGVDAGFKQAKEEINASPSFKESIEGALENAKPASDRDGMPAKAKE